MSGHTLLDEVQAQIQRLASEKHRARDRHRSADLNWRGSRGESSKRPTGGVSPGRSEKASCIAAQVDLSMLISKSHGQVQNGGHGIAEPIERRHQGDVLPRLPEGQQDVPQRRSAFSNRSRANDPASPADVQTTAGYRDSIPFSPSSVRSGRATDRREPGSRTMPIESLTNTDLNSPQRQTSRLHIRLDASEASKQAGDSLQQRSRHLPTGYSEHRSPAGASDGPWDTPASDTNGDKEVELLQETGGGIVQLGDRASITSRGGSGGGGGGGAVQLPVDAPRVREQQDPRLAGSGSHTRPELQPDHVQNPAELQAALAAQLQSVLRAHPMPNELGMSHRTPADDERSGVVPALGEAANGGADISAPASSHRFVAAVQGQMDAEVGNGDLSGVDSPRQGRSTRPNRSSSRKHRVRQVAGVEGRGLGQGRGRGRRSPRAARKTTAGMQHAADSSAGRSRSRGDRARSAARARMQQQSESRLGRSQPRRAPRRAVSRRTQSRPGRVTTARENKGTPDPDKVSLTPPPQGRAPAAASLSPGYASIAARAPSASRSRPSRRLANELKALQNQEKARQRDLRRVQPKVPRARDAKRRGVIGPGRSKLGSSGGSKAGRRLGQGRGSRRARSAKQTPRREGQSGILRQSEARADALARMQQQGQDYHEHQQPVAPPGLPQPRGPVLSGTGSSVSASARGAMLVQRQDLHLDLEMNTATSPDDLMGLPSSPQGSLSGRRRYSGRLEVRGSRRHRGSGTSSGRHSRGSAGDAAADVPIDRKPSAGSLVSGITSGSAITRGSTIGPYSGDLSAAVPGPHQGVGGAVGYSEIARKQAGRRRSGTKGVAQAQPILLQDGQPELPAESDTHMHRVGSIGLDPSNSQVRQRTDSSVGLSSLEVSTIDSKSESRRSGQHAAAGASDVPRQSAARGHQAAGDGAGDGAGGLHGDFVPSARRLATAAPSAFRRGTQAGTAAPVLLNPNRHALQLRTRSEPAIPAVGSEAWRHRGRAVPRVGMLAPLPDSSAAEELEGSGTAHSVAHSSAPPVGGGGAGQGLDDGGSAVHDVDEAGDLSTEISRATQSEQDGSRASSRDRSSGTHGTDSETDNSITLVAAAVASAGSDTNQVGKRQTTDAENSTSEVVSSHGVDPSHAGSGASGQDEVDMATGIRNGEDTAQGGRGSKHGKSATAGERAQGGGGATGGLPGAPRASTALRPDTAPTNGNSGAPHQPHRLANLRVRAPQSPSPPIDLGFGSGYETPQSSSRRLSQEGFDFGIDHDAAEEDDDDEVGGGETRKPSLPPSGMESSAQAAGRGDGPAGAEQPAAPVRPSSRGSGHHRQSPGGLSPEGMPGRTMPPFHSKARSGISIGSELDGEDVDVDADSEQDSEAARTRDSEPDGAGTGAMGGSGIQVATPRAGSPRTALRRDRALTGRTGRSSRESVGSAVSDATAGVGAFGADVDAEEDAAAEALRRERGGTGATSGLSGSKHSEPHSPRLQPLAGGDSMRGDEVRSQGSKLSREATSRPRLDSKDSGEPGKEEQTALRPSRDARAASSTDTMIELPTPEQQHPGENQRPNDGGNASSHGQGDTYDADRGQRLVVDDGFGEPEQYFGADGKAHAGADQDLPGRGDTTGPKLAGGSKEIKASSAPAATPWWCCCCAGGPTEDDLRREAAAQRRESDEPEFTGSAVTEL